MTTWNNCGGIVGTKEWGMVARLGQLRWRKKRKKERTTVGDRKKNLIKVDNQIQCKNPRGKKENSDNITINRSRMVQ